MAVPKRKTTKSRSGKRRSHIKFKTQKYLNYFEKYCKFLRKNSFNNLTKDILTL